MGSFFERRYHTPNENPLQVFLPTFDAVIDSGQDPTNSAPRPRGNNAGSERFAAPVALGLPGLAEGRSAADSCARYGKLKVKETPTSRGGPIVEKS